MPYEPGDDAFAVRTRTGWILYPVCDTETEIESDAIAVRARDGWAAFPVRYPDPGDDAVAVRARGGWIVSAIPCKDDDEEDENGDPPCEGSDPLCDDCPCEANLKETYLVSISGFPGICEMDVFNGVWPVEWIGNCQWEYWITPWDRVSLLKAPGGGWRVGWSVETPGGGGGLFVGDATCPPDGMGFDYYSCNVMWGCEGMCDAIAGATVAVA